MLSAPNRRPALQRAVTLCLLLLATAHCVLSIFARNVSYLDMNAYAHGLEPLPFQRRLLMIPFLRWATASPALNALASRYARFVTDAEPMTAAKLACILLSFLLIAALGATSWRLARRLQLRHGWLPWALLLVVLYASYAARYEQALWYPYDLPHIALFGLATLCLLIDAPLAFLACIAVDVFLRETAVFLLPVALAAYPRRHRWHAVTAAAAVLWFASRWLGAHLYPLAIYQSNHVPWFRMAAPWHWPQIVSIAGFFVVPVWMARHWLTLQQRRALAAATVCIAVTFFFATWNETRAWSEWSMLFAALAAIEIEAAFHAPAQRELP